MTKVNFIDLLYEKYSKDAEKSIHLLPENIQYIMCVLLVHYPICNGGFRHLFECNLSGNVDYALVIKSFNKVGLSHIAQSFKKVLSLFPNNMPPGNMEEREEYLMKFFQDQGEDDNFIDTYSPIVEEAEQLYFNKAEQTIKALEQFYESHT